MRYSIEINNEENSSFVEEADELIDFIVGITLPEVDADQYSTKQNISVKEYAERKAAEFRSVASNNGKELSHSSDST